MQRRQGGVMFSSPETWGALIFLCGFIIVVGGLFVARTKRVRQARHSEDHSLLASALSRMTTEEIDSLLGMKEKSGKLPWKWVKVLQPSIDDYITALAKKFKDACVLEEQFVASAEQGGYKGNEACALQHLKGYAATVSVMRVTFWTMVNAAGHLGFATGEKVDDYLRPNGIRSRRAFAPAA
ncbi:MAG: hypothetical protein V1885_00035 [Candidatus Brennerbacteria bacterium]